MEGGGQHLVFVGAGQQVSGNLFDGELVKRHVAIDGINNPVPPTPGVGPRSVLFVSVAVGIPRLVQPVAAPAFTEMSGFQQPVDQPLVGIGCLVSNESVDLFGTRWQAEQVKAQASDQGMPVGLRRWGQPICGKPGQDEGVDGIVEFCGQGGGKLGRSGASQGLVRPVGLGGAADADPLGPLGPLVNPGTQQSHLGSGQQVALGRHGDVWVEPADVADQQALGAFADRERHPAITSGQGVVTRVEPKTGLLLLGTVTADAVLGQQRFDVLVEIDGLLGWWRKLVLSGGCEGRAKQDKQGESREAGATHHWSSTMDKLAGRVGSEDLG